MRKKICTIAVCVMMILIIMPTGVSAETNDWTYDANNRTLTSADQNITLYNVRASNKHLCIEYNNEKSFKAIDLTGKINGGEYIITELGSESFKNCKSLEEIKLPDSVKEIGSGAFANCKALTSIELPAHIVNIGDYAFGGCSNLKTVVINAAFPPTIGQEIFKSLPDDFRIIVPKESISRYRIYYGWDSYKDRLMISQVGTGSTDHDCEGEDCTICGTQEPGSVCKIIKGENSTWQKGGKDGLSFTSSAAFADFLKVQVDGKDIDASDYTVKEGSTIVTLKAGYLEKLPAGEHTITIVSITGTADTKFSIVAVSDGIVQTGDDSNMAIWVAVMLAAGTALTGTIIYNRKKKYSK